MGTLVWEEHKTIAIFWSIKRPHGLRRLQGGEDLLRVKRQTSHRELSFRDEFETKDTSSGR
jgi:hypothetical protein